MNSRFDRPSPSALVTGVLATGLWIAGLVIGQGFTETSSPTTRATRGC